MNVNAILDEMRAQHTLVGECIIALERLAAQAPRRGRPPLWLAAAKTPAADKSTDEASAPGVKRAKRSAPKTKQ
jgi:hypothetical protein